MTLEAISRVRDLQRWQENLAEPAVPDKVVFKDDWPRTLEGLSEYLRGFLGETGVPLSYVVRKNVEPQADPDPAAPNRHYGWATPQLVMINRAPIMDPADPEAYCGTFLLDSETVWQKLKDLLSGEPCWTFIKPTSQSRNGRKAFMNLWDNYLGPNTVNNMPDELENRLSRLEYKGERRNFKFSDLKRKMVEIFDQSDNLKQHEGCSGIDQRSRVRYLQNAIKTDALNAVQSQIDTSPALQVNFKDACQAFQDFVNRQKPIDTRNVSKVQAEGESAPPQREGYLAWEQCKHAQVQDRYYSEKEYKKLTPLQKAKLHHMRSKRGGGGDTAGGGRRRGNPRKGNGGNKTLKREIKQMVASMMKDARIPVPDAEGTSGSDDDVTNRNNPALKRQKLNKNGGKRSDE